MIIKSPTEGKWVQTNKGDIFGNLWSTRNIDLNREVGKALVSSPVLVSTISTDEATPQSTPFAFAKYRATVSALNTNRYWALAMTGGKTRVFQTTSPAGGTFNLNTSSPEISAGAGDCDMTVFNDKLYIAAGSTLHYRDQNDSWSTHATSIDNTLHLLSVYADRMYISNETKVYSLSTSDVLSKTGSNTLNIATAGNADLNISSMRSTQKGLWIGTHNSKGGRAKMFFWDGVTQNLVDASYKLPTVGVASMTIKDERPYVMGINGVLYTFNGSFFEEVARLDFEGKFTKFFHVWSSHNKFIHPNGMIVAGGEILMLINNESGETNADDDNIPVRTPSGVWAYNETNGLYHKHSLSMQIRNSADIIDYAQLELVGGTDLGAGAMWSLEEDDVIRQNYLQSSFICGYSVRQSNTVTVHCIGAHNLRNQTSSLLRYNQIGVIITPDYFAEKVKENWQKVYLALIGFADGNKATLKYRVQKYLPTESRITWVNATSFTCTSIISDPDATSLAQIKTNIDNGIQYEVEVLQGYGAGVLAQVTGVTESSGTYTFTIDTAIPTTTTTTAKVRFDRWNKVGEMDTLDETEFVRCFNPDMTANKIQFKAILFGKSPHFGVEQIISQSEYQQNY